MDVADHAFLGGRLLLREPRRGHRSGTDAVLLAAAACVEPGHHFMDVGAGAGAAALSILCRVETATATLVEVDPQMAALARHNIEANGFADRAEVVEADLFDKARCQAALRVPADIVISNPPFYLAGDVRGSSNPQRAASHILSNGHHGDWLGRLLSLATAKGRVVLIHRPEALPFLVDAARGRAALRLRAIHPRPDLPATRILVVALVGRRSPFTIDPPLMLHEADGDFTTFVDDLHRGRAWL